MNTHQQVLMIPCCGFILGKELIGTGSRLVSISSIEKGVGEKPRTGSQRSRNDQTLLVSLTGQDAISEPQFLQVKIKGSVLDDP